MMLCEVPLEQIMIFEKKAVPCTFSSCEEGVWCKIVRKILWSFMWKSQVPFLKSTGLLFRDFMKAAASTYKLLKIYIKKQELKSSS